MTLAALFAYSILLILLGLWIGRRVRGARDFFVAGRGLGPGFLFATLLAANIGAGSTVGAAGLGYRDGLSAWWWVGSAGIGSLALAFWVGPAIRRVSAAHDLRTVGDFLEYRYGAAIRGTVAALLWIGTLAILAGQLVALAWVLDAVAGIPKLVACLLGGLVMVTYFVAGGLLTSVWVNVVQLIVLLVGFAVALPLTLAQAGGLDALTAAVPAPDYWNFMDGGSSGWVYLAMLGPAFVVSPGLLQKIYGGRDDRAVKLGVGANAAVLLAFAFVPVLLGITARVLHPELPNHELALPTLLKENLPPLIGGLGLAALFSAEVSTADAILFMLATSLSRDLYHRFLDPAADERRVLLVARLAAIGGGTLGVLLAIVSPTVIGTLSVFYTVLGVTLFVPILAGLYSSRAGMPEVAASIGVGVVTMMAVQIASGGRGIGVLSPALLAIAASAVAFALVLAARLGKTRAR